MFDIPVVFEPNVLHSEEQVYPRFEIDSITETQVKLLLATKSVTMNGKIGTPLYIRSLDLTSFNLVDSLDSYIMFVNMFGDQNIQLAKDKETKKDISVKDLFKFVFD